MIQSSFKKEILNRAFLSDQRDGVRRVGLETEKFILDANTGKAWPVEGKYGLQWIMRELAGQFNYTVISDGNSINALLRDGHQVSLEPGGQIEFSSYQSKYVSELYNAEQIHLDELKQILRGRGAGLSYIACHPVSNLSEVPWVTKKRYQRMRDHFKNTGKLAEWMMKMTASVQVSLDYRDEKEAGAMANTLSKLAPILNAISAFSPIREGQPTGYQSYRSLIWSQTDVKRCGLPKCLFEEASFFDRYREYALKVPMFFKPLDEQLTSANEMSFETWVQSTRYEESQVMDAWRTHLTCLFPEIRMKHYLEVRCFDGMPGAHAFALAALLKGLMYDKETMAIVQKTFTPVEREDTIAGSEAASRFGLKGYYADKSLHAWADWLLKLGMNGIKALATLDSKHSEDLKFIQDLFQDVILPNETYSDKLLKALRSKPLVSALIENPFGFKI